MTDLTLTPAQQEERKTTITFGALAFALVMVCTCFNFVLCFVNTNLFTVNNPMIMACEVVLISLAAYMGFHKLNPMKMFWLAIIVIDLFFILLYSYAKGEVLLKSFRDFLIMPVFLVLGMTAYKFKIHKPLFIFSLIVIAIGFVEAYVPAFLEIFNFKKYYQAKGMIEENTWLQMNTFISGFRPGGRFLLDLPGVHRLASVFLEPISLGFFGFIVGAYFIASKRSISMTYVVLGVFAAAVMIWLADGRMAFGCLAAVVLFSGVFARIDHRLSLLISPLVFIMAYLVEYMHLMSTDGESLGARIHSTMSVLNVPVFPLLLGVGKIGATYDSGWADMFSNQGLIGYLLFWATPVLFVKRASPEARVFIFGTQIYMTLGFLLSPAFFSIKTAALLWFCYGNFLFSDQQDGSKGTRTA